MRNKSNTDFIFLVLIGLLLSNTFIHSYLYNYELNLNNYLGLVAWIFVFVIRVLQYKRARLAVGALLILGTFAILNFTIGISKIGFAIGRIPTSMIGFNMLIFLILIAYYLVNHSRINQIMSVLLYGNVVEKEKDFQNKVEFYTKKFKEFDKEELSKAIKDIDQYPAEAQTAIRKLQQGINY